MKPPAISDEELLKWMDEGLLEVRDVDDPNPRVFFRRRELKAELNTQGGRHRCGTGSERYRFHFREGGRRRKVMRSKIVWMWEHRRVVPDGSKIHHGEGGRLDDRRGNLVCLTNEEHDALHYPNRTPEDF